MSIKKGKSGFEATSPSMGHSSRLVCAIAPCFANTPHAKPSQADLGIARLPG